MDPHLKKGVCTNDKWFSFPSFSCYCIIFVGRKNLLLFSEFLFISDQCETCCSSACFGCCLLFKWLHFHIPGKNPIHSINSLHELATTMADRNRISRLPSLERLFFWIFIGMTLEERERYFLGYNLPLLGGSLNKNLLNKMSCVLSPFFFFFLK